MGDTKETIADFECPVCHISCSGYQREERELIAVTVYQSASKDAKDIRKVMHFFHFSCARSILRKWMFENITGVATVTKD